MLDPVARMVTFKLHREVLGALRPCLSPYNLVSKMDLSYMVLLVVWNMFGQKSLSFIGG